MSLSSCFACTTCIHKSLQSSRSPCQGWQSVASTVCDCIFQLPCISLYSFSASSSKMKRQFLGHFPYCIHCYLCVRLCVCVLHCSLCARTLCIFHLRCFLSFSLRIELSSTYAELTKLLLSAASFIADQVAVLHTQSLIEYRLNATSTVHNIVKWKQTETSIFQYKSCRLHACFRPLSPIPNPMLAPSSFVSLSLPFARPTFAKGKTQYEYRTYIRYLLYIFCLLGGLRTVNKIFQLGWLLYAAQRTCFAWMCMGVWKWVCVSICECVWVSESLSGRLEPVWSACSCTTERKEARRTEGERVYNRVEHRKLFILFLCFNLYLIPFLCSLFFRLPRFNMHFNQNVYVMYVKSRYQNVAILKKYIEIGAHTTKYK